MNDQPPHPLLLAAAVAVVAFLLLPVGVVLLAAVSASSYLTVPPRGLTLHWFAEVLSNPDYLAAIWFSVKLTICAVLLATLLSLPACYALHHRWLPGGAVLTTLLMSPLVFPLVVAGVALLQYASLLGLRGGFLVLVLAHAVIVSPYIVRTVLAGLAGTDQSLEDAARVLGAGRLGAFLLVVLPGIRAALAAGVIFAAITSFDEVTVTIFLLPPGQETLPVTIFTAIEQGVDPSVAAISALMIGATALILIATERIFGFERFL